MQRQGKGLKPGEEARETVQSHQEVDGSIWKDQEGEEDASGRWKWVGAGCELSAGAQGSAWESLAWKIVPRGLGLGRRTNRHRSSGATSVQGDSPGSRPPELWQNPGNPALLGH